MSRRLSFGTMATLIRREYMERIRSRSFIAMTFLIPAFMVVSMLVPLFLATDAGRSRTIAVIDGTGMLTEHLRATLSESTDGNEGARYTMVDASLGDLDMARMLLRERVYDAIVYVPADVFFGGTAEYLVSGSPRLTELAQIRAAINDRVIALRLQHAGMSGDRIDAALKSVDVRSTVVSDSGGSQSPEAVLIGTMLMAFLMYFTLVLYGAWTMRGVVRDKTSRVVEILISTVSPTELMIGKVVGIGAVGLTQVAIWVVVLVGTAFVAPETVVGRYIGALSGPSVPAFILFYITGFLLFGTLYAGVGAMCSSDDDAQQLQWPIMLLLMIPIFLVASAVQSPDRLMIVVLSYVPFFAPILMLLRIIAGDAGWVAFALSLGGIVVTTGLFAWVSGKIFRVGILMTGKRMTLRDTIRFIRES